MLAKQPRIYITIDLNNVQWQHVKLQVHVTNPCYIWIGCVVPDYRCNPLSVSGAHISHRLYIVGVHIYRRQLSINKERRYFILPFSSSCICTCITPFRRNMQQNINSQEIHGLCNKTRMNLSLPVLKIYTIKRSVAPDLRKFGWTI